MVIKSILLSAFLSRTFGSSNQVEQAALIAAEMMDAPNVASTNSDVRSSSESTDASPSAVTPATRSSATRPSQIDACSTYCRLMDAGDCSTVYSNGENCANLVDVDGTVRVSSPQNPSGTAISVETAFGQVSTRSCTAACESASGCTSSFCKPNSHCQGLFWATKSPEAFCFHSETNSCNTETPLHCGQSRTSDGRSGPGVTAEGESEEDSLGSENTTEDAKDQEAGESEAVSTKKPEATSQKKAEETQPTQKSGNGTTVPASGSVANANANESKSAITRHSSWIAATIFVAASLQAMVL